MKTALFNRIEYRNDDGKFHREDGPAIEYFDGSKEWYLNGLRHCNDGPAIDFKNGAKYWFVNDNRHREDGPATIFSNGNKQYWFDDKEYSYNEWQQIIKFKAFV